MMDDKTKLKIIVKTFLCANKGKWFNSRELCDFINNNKLNTRHGVTSTQLSKYLTTAFCNREGIDRDRRNSRNVWYYSIGGGSSG